MLDGQTYLVSGRESVLIQLVIQNECADGWKVELLGVGMADY